MWSLSHSFVCQLVTLIKYQIKYTFDESLTHVTNKDVNIPLCTFFITSERKLKIESRPTFTQFVLLGLTEREAILLYNTIYFLITRHTSKPVFARCLDMG